MWFYGIQLTSDLWYGQDYFCFTSGCIREVKWESVPSHTHKIWRNPIDSVVLGQVHIELSRFWDFPAAEFCLWGSWRFLCSVSGCVGRIGWMSEAALVWSRFSCALGCWEDKTAEDCCTFLVAWCMEPCWTRATGVCSERTLRHFHHPGQCHAGWQWHRRWVSTLGIRDPDHGSAPWEWHTLGYHQQKHLIKQTTREWWQQRQYFQFPGENTASTRNLLALIHGKVISWPRFLHSPRLLGSFLVFQA